MAYNFSANDSDNEREYEIEERIFPNGRKVQAINRESFEYEDEQKFIKFAVSRTATGDCGCSARLQDLYMCECCEKIVCYRHTCEKPCSICHEQYFCFKCMVTLQDGETKTPVCLDCEEQIKPPTILGLIWKSIWDLIKGKKKEESHDVARRNSQNNSKSKS